MALFKRETRDEVLEERIQRIIECHQPDWGRPCWANARWCQACNTSWRVFPISHFPQHQAELIAKLLAGRTP